MSGYLFLAGCGGFSAGIKDFKISSFAPRSFQVEESFIQDLLAFPLPLATGSASTPNLNDPVIPEPSSDPPQPAIFIQETNQDFAISESFPQSPSSPNQCLGPLSPLDQSLLQFSPESSFSIFALEDQDGTIVSSSEEAESSADPSTSKVLASANSKECFVDLYPYSNIDPHPPGQEHAGGPGVFDSRSEASPPAEGISKTLLPTKPQASSPSHSFSSFPIIMNDKVTEFIRFFQEKGDEFFSRSLARSQAYADMMKRIFREKNLPEELFYLALIESGYNPKALSRAKASGIWQFMAKTARRFGLVINKWVDERRDPEKSTYAAAEYLKNLYELFNCWDLAAAGYNAGEKKVLFAMKKAKSQNFWEISRHRYLKRETKRYVPMFHAAILIAKEPQKYGFSNIVYHPPLQYDKVKVPPGTRLAKIAEAAQTDLSTIQELNPALTKGITPPNISQFEVKIPKGQKEFFERNFYSRSSAAEKIHKVKRGETLSQIAKKYKVDLEELCQRNDLSPKSRIRPGMNLQIP